MTGGGTGRRAVLPAQIEKLRAFLLYAALTIEIAVVIVDKSELHNPYDSYFFRLTFVLTLLAVLLGNYTLREWAAIAAAAAFGFFCYRMTGRNEILRVVIFVAACRGRSLRAMLKTAFWETLAGCAGIAFLSVAGIYGSRAVTAVYHGMTEAGEETRYCFGFGHPNALHTMFYVLVLLGMVVYRDRLRWQQLVVLFAANIGLYLLTGSKTGMGITAVTILMVLWMMVSDVHAEKSGGGSLRNRRGFYVAGGVVILLCVGFSVWGAASSWGIYMGALRPEAYSRAWHILDLALSGRINDLYWGALEHAGLDAWSLFSSRSAQRYFDMGWCRLYYWYGIIPATLAVIMLLLLIAWCAKKREVMLLVMIVSMAVYTVVEAHLVSVFIGRNYLLLVFGAAWCEMLGLNRGREVGVPGLLQRGTA